MNAHPLESAVAALVLAAAAIPALRVALKRPIRRELQTHPVVGGLAVLMVLAAVAVTTSIVLQAVVWRRVLVGAVLVVWFLLWLHARVAFGRRRGLPPGSLGLAASIDAIEDPAFHAKAAATFGPVFKMQQVHRPVACVTNLGVAHDLLAQHSDALGQSEWAFNRLVPGGYLEYMEGDAHTRYRAAFARAFTPEVAAAARLAIAGVARGQLVAMSRAEGRAGVHPEPFLYEVPFVSLLQTVLGVTREEPQLPAIRAAFAAITVPFEVHLPTPASIANGYRELVQVVGDLARLAPTSPVPSVLRNIMRDDPSCATDPTVLGNLVLMVKEGSIMVRGLLRWVLKMLADAPQHAQALRASARDEPQLEAAARAFVRETLRLHESQYVYRTVRKEITMAGFRIPRGWLVRLCVGEAHRDPAHFPDPARFDPGRFRDGVPAPDRYCPFGHGTHSCLGEEITLSIASVFAREAALAFDLRTVRDGAPWRINRHWGLWRPSPDWRLTLVPAPAQSHVG